MRIFVLLLGIALASFQCGHLAVFAKEIVIDSLPTPDFMGTDGDFYSPSATSYPKITQVEQSLFKKDFSSEPVEVRLKRIEMQLFKRSYDGYSLSQRTDTVLAAASELAVDKTALNALEKALLSKNFNDSPTNRVARMEQQVFGAIQSGDLNDRIQTLTTAAGSYSAFGSNTLNNTRSSRKNNSIQNYNYPDYGSSAYQTNQNHSDYGGAYSGIYMPQTQNYSTKTVKKPGAIKKSIGSIASFFMGGNPTGWTPQIDPSQWGSPILQNSPAGYGYNNGVQPYNPASSPYNGFRNNTYSPAQQYNPHQGYTQMPYQSQQYQPQLPQFYGQNVQQPYGATSVPQYFDLFSSGGSGSENYYDDGRYNRGFRNSGGGAAVTIIK